MENIFPICYLYQWYSINGETYDYNPKDSKKCNLSLFRKVGSMKAGPLSPVHINAVSHFPITLLEELYDAKLITVDNDIYLSPSLLFPAAGTNTGLRQAITKLSRNDKDTRIVDKLLHVIENEDLTAHMAYISTSSIIYVLDWLAIVGRTYIMENKANTHDVSLVRTIAKLVALTRYTDKGRLRYRASTDSGIDTINDNLSNNCGLTFTLGDLLDEVIDTYYKTDYIRIDDLPTEGLDYHVPDFHTDTTPSCYGVVSAAELRGGSFKYPVSALECKDRHVISTAVNQGLVDFNNSPVFVWCILEEMSVSCDSILDLFAWNISNDKSRHMFFKDVELLLTSRFRDEVGHINNKNVVALLFHYFTMLAEYKLYVNKDYGLIGDTELHGGELLLQEIQRYVSSLEQISKASPIGFFKAIYKTTN